MEWIVLLLGLASLFLVFLGVATWSNRRQRAGPRRASVARKRPGYASPRSAAAAAAYATHDPGGGGFGGGDGGGGCD